jgi:hypothetical protein
MPWVPFTAADVKARLAVRELDVYEETATEESDETPGTEERLPSIVAQVLGQFRGAIRGNPHVTGSCSTQDPHTEITPTVFPADPRPLTPDR